MSISHTPSVEDVAAALAMFGLSQHEPAVLGSLAAATDLRSHFLSVGILQAGELVDYLTAAGDEKGTVLVRIASGRASAAMSSSTILSENTISKLLSRMDTVCVALSFAVGAVASDLRGAAVNFKFLAQRRCRHRAQWLQKQSDEVDAVEKLFLACARLCTASTSDLGVLYSTFLEVSPLLSACVLPAFTSYSSMDVAIVADFRAVLNEMTSLQSVPVDVLDVGRPGLRFCHPGKINSLQFQLIGNGGAPLSGLSPDDVSVSVPVGDATVGAVDALTGSFSISYSVPSICQDKSMTLTISSWGGLVKEIEIPVSPRRHTRFRACSP